MRLGC